MYFDHAATTPIREVARDAWLAASEFLNPAGQYAAGRAANRALSEARETVASLLDCEPIEVIFTGSGTEADNLAIQGLFRQSKLSHVVSTEIEHPAVLETVAALGADVKMLPLTGGQVSSFEPLAEPAALATCMWANNETGIIQPVHELVQAAGQTPVHVDAVQAVGHIPVSFASLGATTLAASAHKFGGPRGVGILLARRSGVAPTLFGGGQQRGIRPGTIDVAGAVATAAALREAVAEIETERARLSELRDRLRTGIELIDGAIIHSTGDLLPGHLHVSFPGAEGDSLIMLLDMLGVAASTGSACASGVNRASHVLLAMGVPEDVARGALRLTLGRTTTPEEVEFLLAHLGGVVRQAREAGMAI
ncbi:cysteine desulfurase [Corynebacterium hindlerae]|uniref:cysteine desulfurase family protein n=1 Tax=Corynebacterium hindlerae TaxID=699041 RepID=UPI001AD639A3|nr:cysteine desulfurase family protein [Corynebacterium hindlerae]QTH59001.1 cysteine desulfurase [Corynebacterium hindlerae]